MIMVDTALARRMAADDPIRVALVGAGYMARCIAVQLTSGIPGMRLAVVANRTIGKAHQVYREAGVTHVETVSSRQELVECIARGRPAITDDARLVCEAGPVEAVIEATGDVEFGSRVAYDALRHGKHVILLNAEVDASVGPILKVHADRVGVVYTYTDGDEPGVAMNLYRSVVTMGCKPVLVGQLKGFLDRYRTPETQKEFAAAHGQNPAIVASFADGSKLALEAAIMGNATGFVPAVRGMHGHRCAHVKDLLTKFAPEDFSQDGLVEYALGAEPHTGAFVIARNDHPVRRKLMSYLKMGDGPLHMFYTPYHLPPMQLPQSVARAVLFQDPTIAPRGAPVCDTIAFAKRDLKAGERLDGMGGFTCYGLVERYEVCRAADYLPMAISVDCRLKRDMRKDEALRYSDVELPAGRLCDQLRDEQSRRFPLPSHAPTAAVA
jgi:predicted homoserine dehydrogenase-like protein